MTPVALEISGLTVGYRDRPVIRNLTLAPILSGQITAIVGPNAAGKSTLLRSLAGLVPAKGAAVLDGFNLPKAGATERAKLVAYMQQTLPGNVELTVFDSVVSAIKSVSEPIADRVVFGRAEAVLERLRIAELAFESISRLSGGKRQLVSLAQAVVRAPRMLLLDEPTSALDLRHQFEVMAFARDLAHEGRIVIVVMHDLALAAAWADRVLVLESGALIADGPPEEALTPAVLKKTYGVESRVERCSRGRPVVLVDGPAEPQRAVSSL